MDLASVRKIVNESPHGVIVRMIDGMEYRLPHRDFVNLGPPPEVRSPRSPHATSFFVWEDDGARLVNALLVKEIVPMPARRNGGKRGSKKKPT